MRIVFLLLCILLPFHARAQECSREDQVEAEERVRLTDFVQLLTVDIPDNCGNFAAIRLVPCRNEIDVVKGCCMDSCASVFEQYSNACLQSLAKTLCAGEDTARAVPILDRLASRCDDDYKPLRCDDDATEDEGGEEEEDSDATEDDAPEDEGGEEEEDSDATEDDSPEEDISTADFVEDVEEPAPGPDFDIKELEFEDAEG